MEQKVNVWKANLTSGLILGLAGVVYSLVIWFLDLSTNKVQGFIFIAIEAVILFFLLKSYRDSYKNGYITFGESVGAGVIISLYYSIIIAVFTYILFAFIDPGLIDKQLAMAEEAMQKKGLPQASIDTALEMQKKFMKPAFMAPFAIIGQMLWGVVLSLIISIFVRKEGNPLIDTPENAG
jgi:hypothetical protein